MFLKQHQSLSKLDLNLRKILVESYIWCTVLYGAETWMLLKIYHQYKVVQI